MADPRLQSVPLLVLGAMRARRRRQVPDWRQSTGLASLLEAGRALPQVAPWDFPDLNTSTGLGKALAEARQWRKEGAGGT